ncbi:MerR family DNA-binding protein [Salmonella enterica subsp. enterica serovar Enteritidis]|nr:MerR family DNA-binding protein [Salmonella enterica subsp. enterica serovar Enteritidis]
MAAAWFGLRRSLAADEFLVGFERLDGNGKLADAAGVNIETIRYYQRRGLLDEPPKPLGGHRRYSAEQVKRVRFIKRAQALGFTLDEIAVLLTLEAACACADTQALAMRKLSLIERKMVDLAAMQQALGSLVK